MFFYPISNFWKDILSFFLMSDRRNINITNSAFNSPKRSDVDRNDTYIQKDQEKMNKNNVHLY